MSSFTIRIEITLVQKTVINALFGTIVIDKHLFEMIGCMLIAKLFIEKKLGKI
jgi:hypothetical protein